MFDVIKTVYKTRKECKENYNSTEAKVYAHKNLAKCIGCATVSILIDATKIGLMVAGAGALLLEHYGIIGIIEKD